MSQDKADLKRDLENANRLIAALALKLQRECGIYDEGIPVKPSEMEDAKEFDAIRFYNPQGGVLVRLRSKNIKIKKVEE